VKIVCLLPAATEIVCALGLRESLVGRSHGCDFPADVASLPALTRPRVDPSLPSARLDDEVRAVYGAGEPLYLLDEERLAALAPDVVVTQAACEVCAVSYEQVAVVTRRAAPAARVVCLLPSRLGDVLEDVGEVAAACGVSARGDALIATLRRRLEAAPPARRVLPRVAVVEWLEPPMLAGHWVPEAVEAAGGRPLGPAAGQPSPYATWEAVRALRPDALVVAPCGFDLARTRREAEPLAPTLRWLAPRVLLMDGNAYLNRPGPRIVEAVETMAAWLDGRSVDGGRACALPHRSRKRP
jgi:iron complex transport system substrate-binding protein